VYLSHAILSILVNCCKLILCCVLLYIEISQCCPPTAIIASNTLRLDVSAIAEKVALKEVTFYGHFLLINFEVSVDVFMNYLVFRSCTTSFEDVACVDVDLLCLFENAVYRERWVYGSCIPSTASRKWKLCQPSLHLLKQ